MKATEQWFRAVLLLHCQRLVRGRQEIPEFFYFDGLYFPVVLFIQGGSNYYAAQGGSTFRVRGWNP